MEGLFRRTQHANTLVQDGEPSGIIALRFQRFLFRTLRFALLKQRLLELVRRGETEEALNFAAERLAPEGAGDPALLREVEEAITLLAFEVCARYLHTMVRYLHTNSTV